MKKVTLRCSYNMFFVVFIFLKLTLLCTFGEKRFHVDARHKVKA